MADRPTTASIDASVPPLRTSYLRIQSGDIETTLNTWLHNRQTLSRLTIEKGFLDRRISTKEESIAAALDKINGRCDGWGKRIERERESEREREREREMERWRERDFATTLTL